MPTPTTINVAGVEVEFPAPTPHKLSEILPLLLPIIAAAGKHAEPERNWIMALHDHALELAEAIAAASGRDVKWVYGLGYADFIRLLQALFDAYGEYLRQCALPNLRLVPKDAA